MATKKNLDYFAELYVAGIMADNGWNIYFPHRDCGMDFIVSKTGIDGIEIIRPVQVKGKYPEKSKKGKNAYGYAGRLNQIHGQMVLAIAYFDSIGSQIPLHIAFMPWSAIKPHSRGFRCEPAMFKNGKAIPRRDYRKYFGTSGLNLVESKSWK